jgi:hypothetical protein
MRPAALTRPRLRVVLPTALFAHAPFLSHSPFEVLALVLTRGFQLSCASLYTLGNQLSFPLVATYFSYSDSSFEHQRSIDAIRFPATDRNN